MQRTDLPIEAARRAAKRERLGRALGALAWVLFFAGLGGVLYDSVSSIPLVLLGSFYVLAFSGAALFTIGAVLRSPLPPPFLKEVGDHWEAPGDTWM